MILDLSDPTAVHAAKLYCRENESARVGLTSGCFDMFHYYHLRFLERCRRYCDILIVGVDSDETIRKSKGDSRPIFHEGHRVRLVENSKYVDFAFVMAGMRSFELVIKLLKPNILFNNGQFVNEQTGADETAGRDLVDEVMIIQDIEERTSTTGFVEHILKNGRIDV